MDGVTSERYHDAYTGRPVDSSTAESSTADSSTAESSTADSTFARAVELGLEPPRFCACCGRRMVVQIVPDGWSSRCSRHGTIDSAVAEKR